MENNKGLIVAIITVAVLAIGVFGATYAFFAASIANNAVTNVVVRSNTLDSLTFTSGTDLSLTLNQTNMARGSSDIDVVSTASTPKAKLIGRNDAASDYCYDLLFDVTDNPYYNDNLSADIKVACTQTSGNSNNTCGSANMGNKAAGTNGVTICSQQKLHTAAGGTQENVYSCVIKFKNLANSDQSTLANQTVFAGKIRFERVACS